MTPQEEAEIMEKIDKDRKLPIIIDGPGTYRTRLGRKVTIHEIRYPPDHRDDCTCFPAKGSIWKTSSKMGLNPEYGIWQLNGKFLVISDSKFDIVSKETIC